MPPRKCNQCSQRPSHSTWYGITPRKISGGFATERIDLCAKCHHSIRHNTHQDLVLPPNELRYKGKLLHTTKDAATLAFVTESLSNNSPNENVVSMNWKLSAKNWDLIPDAL